MPSLGYATRCSPAGCGGAVRLLRRGSSPMTPHRLRRDSLPDPMRRSHLDTTRSHQPIGGDLAARRRVRRPTNLRGSSVLLSRFIAIEGAKRERPPLRFGAGASEDYPRRRPTLPHRLQCSTIGAEGLNCRVRNGNGCFPLANITGKLESKEQRLNNRIGCYETSETSTKAQSIWQVHDRLVQVSSAPYGYAYTPCLYTWSSSRGLRETSSRGGLPA